MAFDLMPSLPWRLVVFFAIAGFILRRIGKLVGWLLAGLWPNEANLSLKAGIDRDPNVASIAGAVALAIAGGTVLFGSFLLNPGNEPEHDLSTILETAAEDYIGLLVVGFIVAVCSIAVRYGSTRSSDKGSEEERNIARVSSEDRTMAYTKLLLAIGAPGRRLLEALKTTAKR